MEQIKTATGKTFDCDFFVTAPFPQMVFFRILNTPLTTIAGVFGNPVETVQLWYADEYVAHYTHFVSISDEGNGIKVCLAKE